MGTPKSTAEATENSANTAQSLCGKVECTVVGETAAFTVRKPENMWKIHKKNTIQNRMKLDKM